MGLYDSYRFNASTAVPTFVPHHEKELKELVDANNVKYDQSKAGLVSMQELVRTAPHAPEDTDLYDQLRQQADQHITELSQKSDLSDVTGDIYKYATHITGRLKDLANEKKKQEDFMASLQNKDLGLDPDTQTKLYQFAKDNSSKFNWDENGRPTGGFLPINPAKAVDKAKKIREYLSIMPDNTDKITVKGISPDGTTEYMNMKGETIKLPVNIQRTLQAAIENDPEIQAWDNQQAMLNTHFSTKGITDEAVLASLQTKPKTDADAVWLGKIKQYIDKGVKPTAALKAVEEQRHLSAIRSQELQYGLGATKLSQESENSKDLSWSEKERIMQENRMKVAKTSNTIEDTWHIPGAVLDVPEWKGTGKDLTAKLDKFTATSANYDAQIAKLQYTATQDKNATDESRIDAQQKILSLQREKAQNETLKATIKAGKERLLEKAAQDLKFSSWPEVKELAAKKVASQLSSLPESKNIAKALVEGDYQVVSSSNESTIHTKNGPLHPTENQIVISGKKYSVGDSRKILNAIGTQFKDFQAIQDKANTYATDVTGLETTQVPVRKEDRETMGSSLQSMKLYDVNNSGAYNTDGKKIDWSKSRVGNSMPELGLISATINEDGVDKTVFFDPGGSYWRHRGEQLLKSDDPEMRQTGKDMVLNNYSKYRNTFNQASGIVYKHPATGNPISYKGQEFGIHRNKDGTFSVVDAKTRQLLGLKLTPTDTEGKTSHTFGEITSFLNNLISTN